MMRGRIVVIGSPEATVDRRIPWQNVYHRTDRTQLESEQISHNVAPGLWMMKTFNVVWRGYNASFKENIDKSYVSYKRSSDSVVDILDFVFGRDIINFCCCCCRFFFFGGGSKFLCRMRSIAAHKDNFVRCLSVRPCVCLSGSNGLLAMFRRRHMHSLECCHSGFIITTLNSFVHLNLYTLKSFNVPFDF